MGIGFGEYEGGSGCPAGGCCNTSTRKVQNCCISSSSACLCVNSSGSCCTGSSGCCTSSTSCSCSGSTNYLVTTSDSYYYKSTYGTFKLALNAVHGFAAFDGANKKGGTNGTSRFFSSSYYDNTIRVQTSSTSYFSGYQHGSTKYYVVSDGYVWKPNADIHRNTSGSGSTAYYASVYWTVPSASYLGPSAVSGTLAFYSGSTNGTLLSMEFAAQTPGTYISPNQLCYGNYSTIYNGHAYLQVYGFGVWERYGPWESQA